MTNSCTLVAIARNEQTHILEWLAYNLALGFERIIIFDNDSSDLTANIVASVARREPRVSLVHWSPTKSSPQCTAYNHALTLTSTSWLAFLDIDEFLVFWHHRLISDYLATIPDDISAINVNWRSFGSSGRVSDNYLFVTEAFTKCAAADWPNHLHFKTLARRERIVEAFIHYVTVDKGRRTLSDFQDVPDTSEGIAHAIAYNGIQINHYQTKTWIEFSRRMKAGDAYFPDGHPAKSREGNAQARFEVLDRNEDQDARIERFLIPMKQKFWYLERAISTKARILYAHRLFRAICEQALQTFREKKRV